MGNPLGNRWRQVESDSKVIVILPPPPPVTEGVADNFLIQDGEKEKPMSA